VLPIPDSRFPFACNCRNFNDRRSRRRVANFSQVANAATTTTTSATAAWHKPNKRVAWPRPLVRPFWVMAT